MIHSCCVKMCSFPLLCRFHRRTLCSYCATIDGYLQGFYVCVFHVSQHFLMRQTCIAFLVLLSLKSIQLDWFRAALNDFQGYPTYNEIHCSGNTLESGLGVNSWGAQREHRRNALVLVKGGGSPEAVTGGSQDRVGVKLRAWQLPAGHSWPFQSSPLPWPHRNIPASSGEMVLHSFPN